MVSDVPRKHSQHRYFSRKLSLIVEGPFKVPSADASMVQTKINPKLEPVFYSCNARSPIAAFSTSCIILETPPRVQLLPVSSTRQGHLSPLSPARLQPTLPQNVSPIELLTMASTLISSHFILFCGTTMFLRMMDINTHQTFLETIFRARYIIAAFFCHWQHSSIKAKRHSPWCCALSVPTIY